NAPFTPTSHTLSLHDALPIYLTVISITHDIDEAANANRIFVMKQGELVNEGTPEEIFSAGPELINLGLDLPFPEKLKSALKQRGDRKSTRLNSSHVSISYAVF